MVCCDVNNKGVRAYEICVCPLYLVVEACAMMLPPMGFFGSAANMEAPSTCATTWFVITTATPNCRGTDVDQLCRVQGVHQDNPKMKYTPQVRRLQDGHEYELGYPL